MRINQYSIFGFFLLLVSAFCGIISLRAATLPPLNIDEGHSRTEDRRVNLSIHAPKNSRRMKVSNNSDFEDANWENIKNNMTWILETGSGLKTVYIKFQDNNHHDNGSFSDTITLSSPEKFDATFEINKGADETHFRRVDLTFEYTKGIESIEVSNSSNFSESETFAPLQTLNWTLTPGTEKKTVYVRFTDVNEKTYVLSHDIQYRESVRYIPEGTILKGQSNTLYYLGYDQKLHPFYSLSIFHSWQKDFSQVVYVSNAKLTEYAIGSPVCLRAGSWLVKFPTTPRIYAVEPGCQLRPLRSETEAFAYYGDTWQKRIIELPEFLKNFYTVETLTEFERSEDADQDGVDTETENFYSTSDAKADTDRDGVSDYEEIYYWFSDPLQKDTNSNGVTDSAEIRKNLSPLSSLAILSLPEGSYPVPVGSAFQTPEGRSTIFYQYDLDDTGSISESTFAKFNAPLTFVSKTPFNFVAPRKRSLWSYFSRKDETQFSPSIFQGKTLRPL